MTSEMNGLRTQILLHRYLEQETFFIIIITVIIGWILLKFQNNPLFNAKMLIIIIMKIASIKTSIYIQASPKTPRYILSGRIYHGEKYAGNQMSNPKWRFKFKCYQDIDTRWNQSKARVKNILVLLEFRKQRAWGSQKACQEAPHAVQVPVQNTDFCAAWIPRLHSFFMETTLLLLKDTMLTHPVQVIRL